MDEPSPNFESPVAEPRSSSQSEHLPPEPDDASPSPAEAENRTCFVIGPIGNKFAAHGSDERAAYEESLEVWEEVVLPACNSYSLDPIRSDGLARPGEITEQIFRRLRDDDVVIADLTGANPNVMYELGLRHSHYYASLLIRHGESVKVVQARLGHASASETLDTYSHLWPDSEDRTRSAVDSVFSVGFSLDSEAQNAR
jgi:hypothetical protein